MVDHCQFCGDKIDRLPWECSYCGELNCDDHRLPEAHLCTRIRKRKKFKKFKPRKRTVRRWAEDHDRKFYGAHHTKKGIPHIKAFGLIMVLIIGGFFLLHNNNFSIVTSALKDLTDSTGNIINKKVDETKRTVEEIDFNLPEEPISIPSLPKTIGCSVIQIEYNYPDSEEDSKAAIDYLNNWRTLHGKRPIKFDERVFNLAIARSMDMRDYGYLDHTNPETGACPDNMKSEFGLNANEFVAENVFGNPEYVEDACSEIEIRPLTEVVDSWMESRGHRFNLMFDDHVAGAIGCYKNMCTFLGLNKESFGQGCSTAAEGEYFWATEGKQPGEV